MVVRLLLLSFLLSTQTYAARSFFMRTPDRPYHLSVGAVLFNDQGKIACHHFHEAENDLYILMRESMENKETPLETLHRGLMEEFGATAVPVAFIGATTQFLDKETPPFEKTTLYVVCRVKTWDSSQRKVNDREASSSVEWLSPEELMAHMEEQGRTLGRADTDETVIVQRALRYVTVR